MAEQKYTVPELVLSGIIAIPLIVVILVLMLPFILLVTWIRLQLYNWFAVPYLHVPSIPFWVMFGLGTLLGTFYYAKPKSSEYEPTTGDNIKAMIVNFASWMMAWGIGYVVHTWILTR